MPNVTPHQTHVWHATIFFFWWVLQHCTGFARLVWGRLRVHPSFYLFKSICVFCVFLFSTPASHSPLVLFGHSALPPPRNLMPHATPHQTHVWHATIICVWEIIHVCVCDVIHICNKGSRLTWHATCVCELIHICNKGSRLTWQRIRCAQQNPMTHPSFQYVGWGREKKRRKKK